MTGSGFTPNIRANIGATIAAAKLSNAPILMESWTGPGCRNAAVDMKSATVNPIAATMPKLNTYTVDGKHLVVMARAGTGKTSTIVGGMFRLKDGTKNPIAPFEPSPQQLAIWEALDESKNAKTAAFVAFGKAIADELEKKVPNGYTASTFHRMGFKAVRASFKLKKRAVNGWRVDNIVEEITGKKSADLRKWDPTYLRSIKALVSLAKANLVGYDVDTREFNSTAPGVDRELRAIMAQHDINAEREEAVLEMVPKVLDRCLDVDGGLIV